MKKFLSVLLCLLLVLSLAACAAEPADNTGTTTTTTTTTTEADTTPTDPVDDPVDEPADEDPTEIGEYGVLAVGIVDSAAKTAKVVGGNSAVQEITYTGEDPVPGRVYFFEQSGDAYALTEVTFFDSYDYEPWGLRTYDNTYDGRADALVFWDGTLENPDDGSMGWLREVYLTDDAVCFIRYSATEWRVLRGNDIIAGSDYPMPAWFAVDANTEDGWFCPVFMIGNHDAGGKDTIKPMTEGETYLMDPEGFGWYDGDIIIE